jgi:hypothetical protein
MAEKEYLDVVGFITEGREQKRKPVTIGYAYRNDKGDLSIKLRSVPVGSWDGSLIVQKRRERDQPNRSDANDAGAPDDAPFGFP